MPYKDVREFIAKLEAEGEMQRIEEEVDWNLEAGAIARRTLEEKLPAPYFQKIKDSPHGFTLASGFLANHRRIAMAFEMDPDTHPRQLIEEYLRRKKKQIKPVLVNEGPCKENIQIGEDVDLLKFPVPFIHGGDGGRYIGTWHLTVTKDADSDWTNWGMYRHMLHDKNTMGILALPPKHFALMYEQSCERCGIENMPMDVALVIGTEPISTFCSGTPMPYGVAEIDVAGGLRGEPVEVVKCETVDLTVPATAEIVIEGELVPGESMDEGPFGEYTGYRSGQAGPMPVIRVKAVTHRNDPIFTMSCMGIPVDDNHALFSVNKSAAFLEELRDRGLPVSGAYIFPEGVSHGIVVAVKPSYYGMAGEIAHVIWGSRHGCITPWVIVVEDDVDPFNMDEVLHAMMSKCHPSRGIVKVEQALAWPLFPWLSEYERGHRMGARVYFDCTWPVHWDPSEVPARMSFKEAYPEEIQQKALEKLRK